MSKKSSWREWYFPELTSHENAIVAIARHRGYASFFPSYPDAKAQAKSTLNGAHSFIGLDDPAEFFNPALQAEIESVAAEIAKAKS